MHLNQSLIIQRFFRKRRADGGCDWHRSLYLKKELHLDLVVEDIKVDVTQEFQEVVVEARLWEWGGNKEAELLVLQLQLVAEDLEHLVV